MPEKTHLPNPRLLATLAVAAVLIGAAANAQTLPTFSATPGSLAFTYTIGAVALPAAQTLTVKTSSTTAVLDCTTAISPAAPWMVITPGYGKTPLTLTVRMNPTGLGAGTYVTSILVTSAGAGNSPINVPVTLTVKNPPPTMTLTPASLLFNYATDDASPPPSQTLNITTNGEPVNFTAVASGGAWLSVTPASGISLLGSPIQLTVSVKPQGLLPSTYSGKITISSTNASNKTVSVNVSMVIAAGTAVLTSVWPPNVALGSVDTTVTLTGSYLYPTSVVHVGAAAVTSTWIGTEALMAVVPAALLSTQGTLALTVTNAPRPASNALNWNVTAPGPRIWAVANAASFAMTSPASTIAPGEIIAITGSGLGTAIAQVADPSNGAYPTTIGTAPATTIVELEVTAGQWVAMPIIMAEAGQVNAVVPFNMTPATGMNMRVTYNGVVSANYTVDSASSMPGIFTMDASGQGQAAVLNYIASTNSYTLNSAANPAAKGSIVAIYATGGGVTSTLPSPEGQLVPLGGTLPTLVATTTVTIGADTVSPDYAGGVPTAIAGLVQLNVTLPSTALTNKATPLYITVGGRTSPAGVTIAIK